MKYPIISKEKFCEYINLLKKMDEKEESLTDAFRNLDENADVSLVGLYTTERLAILDLLNTVMDAQVDENFGSDIEYFCYELEFGKRYLTRDDWVTDADGNKIDLSTPEKLYDYLVKEYYDRYPDDTIDVKTGPSV